MDRVPELYRLIIDDVLRTVKVDMEKYGWDEDTVARKLTKLQQKWESKINQNGCLDPTNCSLDQNGSSSSVITKAAKRRQAIQAKREAMEEEEKAAAAAGPRPRAPLTYPILNPQQQQASQAISAQQAVSSVSAQPIAPTLATVAPPPAEDELMNPYESTSSITPLNKRQKLEPTSAPAALSTISSSAAAPTPSPFLVESHQPAHSSAAAAAASSSQPAAAAPSQSSSMMSDDPTPLSAAHTAAFAQRAEAIQSALKSSSEFGGVVIPSITSSDGYAVGEPIARDLTQEEIEAQEIIAGRLPASLTSTQLGPEDDDSDEEEANAQIARTEDMVLCQFEKVAHQKDRWKVVLKDGIIRVNQRDFVFSKATGEFDW